MPRTINAGLSHHQTASESYKINDYKNLVHKAPIKKPVLGEIRQFSAYNQWVSRKLGARLEI